METVENQRTVTINKELVPKGTKESFTAIKWTSLENACNRIKKLGSLKLWLYLSKNKDKFRLVLSRVDCMNFCKFTKDTYRTAFQDLNRLGFITPEVKDWSNPPTNHFYFYEYPEKHKQENGIDEKIDNIIDEVTIEINRDGNQINLYTKV